MSNDIMKAMEWLNIGLPKWPQMFVVGKPVTEEQAKEIIFRTDGFFFCLSEYGGGNNDKWNNACALARRHC